MVNNLIAKVKDFIMNNDEHHNGIPIDLLEHKLKRYLDKKSQKVLFMETLPRWFSSHLQHFTKGIYNEVYIANTVINYEYCSIENKVKKKNIFHNLNFY